MPPPTDRIPRGLFSVSDEDGMGLAILMLINSLNLGKSSDTVQWATIRSLRSALSNYYRTIPAAQTASVEADQPSGSHRDSDSPTSSRWFERVSIGMHARLGDVVIQDKAITIDETKVLLLVLEEHWNKFWVNDDQVRLFELATVGAMACAAFGGAL
eukprot:CAMPEP_0178898890 /NCGR_PEP_ID=MMETSP0786-20121207/2592_1 /TAXON_ID=186022 /ORGANISM="Thalassionema frauenfeldii, Strain CCMP 1798" /LENGTH=156 /DNA_ID=CAMNT_0020569679 /DNA_START=734 /DNA_END=1204 /DNA_ORIENTATION=-